MKNKIKIALFIVVILILIILLFFVKIYNKSDVKYGIQNYDSFNDYTDFINNNIYRDKNKNDVIKISAKYAKPITFNIFVKTEIYIDTTNKNIYKCEFVSGCASSYGFISTEKIEKQNIKKILSLKDENINSEDIDTYWTLEYKDNKINIVNISEELTDIFDVSY